MVDPALLLRLGDLGVTLPSAAAIGVWLLAAGAWRMALWWCALFGLTIALVGASKIAFMSWGMGAPALAFKSLSGHAAGVSAVAPTLFYLLLQAGPARRRHGAIGAGLFLGLAVAALLVMCGEHSAAEALGGCLAGAMASVGAIGLGDPPIRPAGQRALLLAGASFALVAWLMQSAQVGWWMIKAARVLSGRQQIFPLATD